MKKILITLILFIVILQFSACSLITLPLKMITKQMSESPESTLEIDDASLEITDASDADSEYNFEGVTIVDDENCTFKILGLDPEGLIGWGPSFSVYFKNKTDESISFSWDDVSINGYIITLGWFADLPAGEELEANINISQRQLDELAIGKMEELTFTLKVLFTSNAYDTDLSRQEFLVDEEYTIYPTGLSAESIVYPERTSVEGEQVAVNNHDFVLIYESMTPTEEGGYNIRCYLENKMDINLRFAWRDMAVNDEVIKQYYSEYVPRGKRVYTEIRISHHSLDSHGINDLSEITYFLQVLDDDDCMAPDIYYQGFTYRPSILP